MTRAVFLPPVSHFTATLSKCRTHAHLTQRLSVHGVNPPREGLQESSTRQGLQDKRAAALQLLSTQGSNKFIILRGTPCRLLPPPDTTLR